MLRCEEIVTCATDEGRTRTDPKWVRGDPKPGRTRSVPKWLWFGVGPDRFGTAAEAASEVIRSGPGTPVHVHADAHRMHVHAPHMHLITRSHAPLRILRRRALLFCQRRPTGIARRPRRSSLPPCAQPLREHDTESSARVGRSGSAWSLPQAIAAAACERFLWHSCRRQRAVRGQL